MELKPLLHPDKAVHILLDIDYRLPEEKISLNRARGRVLSRTIENQFDSPPFDKAAMDGFAIRSDDYEGLPGEKFTLIETVAAGDMPCRTPGPKECVRIMTGAPMPAGTDRVIRVEFTEMTAPAKNGDRQTIPIVTVHTPEEVSNVIPRGKNIKTGEILLEPCMLGAKEIGILAAGGIDQLTVKKQTNFGIITTGSEIIEPGEPLKDGQIYNSNGSQLAAQVAEAGGIPFNYGIVKDDPGALRKTIQGALEERDILLLSGGVSMGDFDFVPEILRELGVEILFHRLAIKPGRPTLFGRRDNTFVFGLPGNPVSTFVIFELFVRTFLGVINEVPHSGTVARGRLGETVSRKSSSRVEYRPAILDEGLLLPLPYYSSSHLNALKKANCLFHMDQGIHTLSKGTEIDARLI